MKTHRVALDAGPDEFVHTCTGHVDGEPCPWTYSVARHQPDVDGHDTQRHADADAAYAEHLAEHHPTAKPERHGAPR